MTQQTRPPHHPNHTQILRGVRPKNLLDERHLQNLSAVDGGDRPAVAHVEAGSLASQDGADFDGTGTCSNKTPAIKQLLV